MELKEKFKDCAIVDAVGMIDSDKCVEIAEDYAIGFADWFIYQDITMSEKGIFVNNKGELVTFKQLLELYNNSLNKQ